MLTPLAIALTPLAYPIWSRLNFPASDWDYCMQTLVFLVGCVCDNMTRAALSDVLGQFGKYYKHVWALCTKR